jgi:hypothetical protein
VNATLVTAPSWLVISPGARIGIPTGRPDIPTAEISHRSRQYDPIGGQGDRQKVKRVARFKRSVKS